MELQQSGESNLHMNNMRMKIAVAHFEYGEGIKGIMAVCMTPLD